MNDQVKLFNFLKFFRKIGFSSPANLIILFNIDGGGAANVKETQIYLSGRLQHGLASLSDTYRQS